MENNLWQISPVDGRYADKTAVLQQFTGEAALIRYRIQVEIEWLIALAEENNIKELKALDEDVIVKLRNIYLDFNSDSAAKVKAIEVNTNHDVKAVEYFLKEVSADFLPDEYMEYFHFACTSEDINSTAYALMLKDLNISLIDNLLILLSELKKKILVKILLRNFSALRHKEKLGLGMPILSNAKELLRMSRAAKFLKFTALMILQREVVIHLMDAR